MESVMFYKDYHAIRSIKIKIICLTINPLQNSTYLSRSACPCSLSCIYRHLLPSLRHFDRHFPPPKLTSRQQPTQLPGKLSLRVLGEESSARCDHDVLITTKQRAIYTKIMRNMI